MSLFSIVQDVADEIGVIRPSSLVASEDPTARRFLADAKATGQDMFRSHNWSILHRLHSFDTKADVGNYALPEDWGRPLANTAWDRHSFFQMVGNRTPEQWQRFKSGLEAAAGLRRHYRILAGPLAGSILIDPVPGSAGEELVIEYVTKFWAEDSTGEGKATFTADDDEIRLDHEVFRLGLLWRAARSLGLPYSDERLDHRMAMRNAIKADINLPTFNVVPERAPQFPANVPEGSFPGPTS